MMPCKNCRRPIESADATGIGLYWFHSRRDITGSIYCGLKKADWRFAETAEPFAETVYIVDRDFKITNWGFDGMFFLLGECIHPAHGLIWDLVDIDDPERIVSVPRHHVKEPFERMVVEDAE